MRKESCASRLVYMSNTRYTKAQRLALAIKRDAELVASRAAMSDADIADLTGAREGEDVQTSLRLYTWADFVAAYRSGDILNAHRNIIARDGAAR
ncbi:hypothetical protein SEA_CARON_65 [Microbacterium phage Caron]|uniref:Uncharacterized protein n=1 Tax=Microbacterium phage Caron TaxID=3028494 RepID=A0AAE9ZNP9_9CAUD|nr:hypothetical protein SEA_CARON_65 [Microbacterium phage Caron]